MGLPQQKSWWLNRVISKSICQVASTVGKSTHRPLVLGVSLGSAHRVLGGCGWVARCRLLELFPMTTYCLTGSLLLYALASEASLFECLSGYPFVRLSVCKCMSL